jgi:phosphatidylglycerophosphatase A
MDPHDPLPIEDAQVRTETPAGPPGGGPQIGNGAAPPRRASVRLMFSHPAHALSFGFGSGLSPVAPGTAGTLWAWLAYTVLSVWLTPLGWGLVLAVGTAVGVWACTRTAQALGTSDPSAVVWDEILAFWAILWLLAPASFQVQLAAFVLFRFFDAVKPGPVAWADRLFKPGAGQPPGWRQGVGILLDDAVAALCTLLVLALWRVLVG